MLIAVLALCSVKLVAQDRIEFTWYAGGMKEVTVKATGDYTVYWSDGTIETEKSYTQTLKHTYTISELRTVTIVASNTDCRFTYFKCSYGAVKDLDLTNCRNLTYLDCSMNTNLSNLNLRACSALEYLNCSGNPDGFSNLDLTGCYSLQTLICEMNFLPKLDLSSCPALTKLYCDYNYLTNLDISRCPNLIYLDCSNNRLTSLNISGNTVIQYIKCFNNQMTNLNMNGCTSLWRLDCQGNRLLNLNPKGCNSLEILNCYSNDLRNLDLNDCPALVGLGCGNNALRNLDLSSCPSLQELYCSKNQLQLSELFAKRLLIDGDDKIALSPQYSVPQTVPLGEELFSEQSVFNGIYTKYTVMNKKGNPAPLNDYSVNRGKLTFNTTGEYTVTMTNEAISVSGNPAEVIVETKVIRR